MDSPTPAYRRPWEIAHNIAEWDVTKSIAALIEKAMINVQAEGPTPSVRSMEQTDNITGATSDTTSFSDTSRCEKVSVHWDDTCVYIKTQLDIESKHMVIRRAQDNEPLTYAFSSLIGQSISV